MPVIKAVKEPKKRVKEARSWEMGGKKTDSIDYSTPASDHVPILLKDESHLKGTMGGELGGVNGSSEDSEVRLTFNICLPYDIFVSTSLLILSVYILGTNSS